MCFTYHDDCTLNDRLYYALRHDITRWVIPQPLFHRRFPNAKRDLETDACANKFTLHWEREATRPSCDFFL